MRGFSRYFDFSRSNFSADGTLLRYSKAQGAITRLIRNRTAFMNLKQPGLILDVGCGPNSRPENINLDRRWHPGIDICCDITRGLPLPENYVRGIYSEHCLEHIPFKAALSVLREFHRVAMPGSHVRIVVPDFEIYVDAYDEFRRSGETAAMPYASADSVEGIYSPVMSVNRIFRDHGHLFIYDFATLAAMLEKAGFDDLRKRSFRVGTDSALLLDTPAREIESLYVEARRP